MGRFRLVRPIFTSVKTASDSSKKTTRQATNDLLPCTDFDKFLDDFIRELNLICEVCRIMTVEQQLVQCQKCLNVFHKDCDRPQVTGDVSDSRLGWICSCCTTLMKDHQGETNDLLTNRSNDKKTNFDDFLEDFIKSLDLT